MKILKTFLATVTAFVLCSCGAGKETAKATELFVNYNGVQFSKPLWLEKEEAENGLFYRGYADGTEDEIYYYITTEEDYSEAIQTYFPYENDKSSLAFIKGREAEIDGVNFHIREGTFHTERYIRVGENADLYLIECTGEADGQQITAVAFSETQDSNTIKEMRNLFYKTPIVK